MHAISSSKQNNRLIAFAGHPLGFIFLLGLALTIFLLVVGVNDQSLPFIPGAQYSDAVISHWPNALFFQRTIQSGIMPLWRSLMMSGQPFTTNPLNKVWYPFEWALLVVPPILYLNAMLWLHLLLAGVGMRALAQCLDFPVEISSMIGVAYAFTPRLIALSGAGHLDAVAAWSWLPWLLWSVVVLRWRWIATFGALCFLGDVRTAALIFVLAAAFIIWRMTRHTARKYVTTFILAVIIMIGLTAAQWLPLLFALPTLSRGGLTVADAGIFSLTPASILGLLFSVRSGSQETMVYIGMSVLTLAILGGIGAWRKARFWIAAIVAAGVYALGVNSPIWLILVKIIPALLWLRVPARAWQIAVLALIMLSGFGLQILFDPIKRSANRRLIVRLGVGLIGITGMLSVIVLLVAPISAIVALLLAICSGALLLARLKNRQGMIILWFGLIAFDLLLMDTSLLQGRDQSQWLDTYQPLAQALIVDKAVRVYASPEVLPQQVAAYWKIETFGGVDPFQFTSYVTLSRLVNRMVSPDYSVVLPNFADGVTAVQWGAGLDLRLLAQWQVTHIVADMPIDRPGLILTDRVIVGAQNLYVYANTLYHSDRFIVWGDTNHVTLRADDTTDGVLSDLHGWTRTVTADGLATYSYMPAEIFVGAGATLLTLALLVGSWIPKVIGKYTRHVN